MTRTALGTHPQAGTMNAGNPHHDLSHVPLFPFTYNNNIPALYLRGQVNTDMWLWLQLEAASQVLSVLWNRDMLPQPSDWQPVEHHLPSGSALNEMFSQHLAWYISPRTDALQLVQPYLDAPPTQSWITPQGEALHWSHVQLPMTGGTYNSLILSTRADGEHRPQKMVLPTRDALRQVCLSISGQQPPTDYYDDHGRLLQASPGVLKTPWNTYSIDLGSSRLKRAMTLCGTRPISHATFERLLR